mgnify:CR=1 FL=1
MFGLTLALQNMKKTLNARISRQNSGHFLGKYTIKDLWANALCYGVQCLWNRPHMGEILPIRRKTLCNKSIIKWILFPLFPSLSISLSLSLSLKFVGYSRRTYSPLLIELQCVWYTLDGNSITIRWRIQTFQNFKEPYDSWVWGFF